MPKVAVVTEQDVATFLARNPRKKRHKLRKVKPATATLEEMTDEFLRSFSAQALFQALRTREGKPLDIHWYVERLLSIYKEADQAKDRLAVLDRIRGLTLIGAIQDPALQEHLVAKVPELRNTDDPFAGKKLKIRRA